MAQLSSGEISLKFFCTIDFLSFSSITLRVFSTSDFVLQDFVVYGLVTLWSLSTKVFFDFGLFTPEILWSTDKLLYGVSALRTIYSKAQILSSVFAIVNASRVGS